MPFSTLKSLKYNYQSGFHQNHSTDFCLFFLNNKILKDFDKSMIIGVILTFVFYTCMLMVSLNFQQTGFNFISSKRSFLINSGGNFFQPAYVSNGVPQASNLDPLLLLIYINDMTPAIKCILFLHAEDSCLVRPQ